MASTPAEVAYDQALRNLTEQRDRLSNLRTRSATVISAAAIVTSFLGSEALKDTRVGHEGQLRPDRSLESAECVAIGAFVAVVILCLVTLLPLFKAWLGGWHFRLDAYDLVSDYVDDPQATLDEVHRDLALHMESHYRANERKLGALFTLFAIAALMLGVEVVAWVLDLA